MPRTIYYQSSGNPLQQDRLPSRTPRLALPFQLPSVTEIIRLLAILFASGLVIVFLTAVAARSTPTWGFVDELLLLCVSGIFIVQAIKKRDIAWIITPLPTLLAVYVCISLPWPPVLLILACGAAFAVLTWRFGRHWTDICTATPLDRATAKRLRHSWNGYLQVAALLLPGSLLGCWILGCWPLAPLLILFVMFVQFVQTLLSPGRRRILAVMVNSIVSWFSYNRSHRTQPGLYRSSAGLWCGRVTVSAACLVLMTTVETHAIPELIRGTTGSPIEAAAEPIDSDGLTGDDADARIEESAAAYAIGAVSLTVMFLAPILMTVFVPVGLTLPVLVEAAGYRRTDVTPDRFNNLVHDIQTSPDPIERRSIYRGRILSDGSPLLVPREVFDEHAHFLGDSGAGKTSLGLLPTMEQLLAPGDCSMIVLDLKADSLELLASLQAALSGVRRRTGKRLPLQHFTNQTRKSTCAFNVLTQPYWRDFELYMRTDILCGALGLQYGSDYGEGYYSSANAAVLYHTIKTYPEAQSFRELADRVAYIVTHAKKQELHPEIRKAGVHVQEVLKRLGSFEALNVTAGSRYNADVLAGSIDLSRPFREPSLMYFHLSAALSPGSSPELARLVAYSLLSAATQTQRNHQVYLVIDEFQRMVSRNIEYMLQLARSMGVSVILANQSMQDLKTSTANLIPAIEANCRYREWFAVSSSDDRRQLIDSSGETVDYLTSRSSGSTPGGNTSSVSHQEVLLPRLSSNDILLASDHPRRSIVRISRGAGYAQYGGMPFIVENNFHITAEEYGRRKAIAWPEGVPGTFVPRGDRGGLEPDLSVPPAGPVVTSEVIGGPPRSDSPLPENPFDSYLNANSDKRGSRSRRPRNS